MELDAIHVFVKVVEAGSFSAAAKLLDMPKTTASAKVAALEKRLGVSLLHRTTRKLSVSEAGRRYYDHCAKAIAEIELGEAALSSTKEKPSGLLRVTVPIDIGHTIMPRIASAFLAAHPDVSVEMILSNRIVDLVGEGVDLAIRAGNLKDSSLIARRFFDSPMRLWASPAYLEQAGVPGSPKELAGHRFVGYVGMKSVRLSRDKRDVEVAMHGRAVTDDIEAIRAMLILGDGIGLLPDFLALEAEASGELVSVLGEWTLQSIGGFSFVYPGQRYASPKVQAFIGMALQMVEAGSARPASGI